MRRRPFGLKRADVEAALDARDAELDELGGELDARDAELAELRQDIAALWLAFAQHDRTLAELREAAPAPAGVENPASPEPAGAAASPISRQLADLDEVLAAIEMATQTLEQTYAEEGEAEAEGEGEDSGGD